MRLPAEAPEVLCVNSIDLRIASTRVQKRYREWKAHLSRKHADREAAPRFQYRPDRPLRSRLRRAVGHDLFLRDQRRDRRAEADRTLPDRQGRELGRNRRLRLEP